MKSLIKKELFELALILSIPFVVLCIVWIAANRFENTLLAPVPGPMMGVLGAAYFSGVLAAFFQFEGERRKGTLGYLLHRGTGHRGVFLAKVASGLAGTALLTIGPPIVYAVWHALLSPNAGILQWARIADWCWLGTFGASVYAVSALATQLRRGLFVDLLVALVGGAGLFVLGALSLVLTIKGGTLAFTVGLQIVIASALLVLASRLFLKPRDRDLPLAPSHHAAALALAALVLLPSAGMLVAGMQLAVRSSLLDGYPTIVQAKSDGEVMVAAHSEGRIWKRLDESGNLVEDERLVRTRPSTEHDVVGEPFTRLYHPMWPKLDDPAEITRIADWLDHPQITHPHGFALSWVRLWDEWPGYESPEGQFRVMVYFDHEEGCLRMFAVLHPSEGETHMTLEPAKMPPFVPCAVVVSKPGGAGRFSASTRLLYGWGKPCLVDPEDETLWSLDLHDFVAPIGPLTLPDGDRFAGFLTLFDRASLRVGRYAFSETLVRGEKGVYSFDGERFIAGTGAYDRVGATPEEAPALIELRVIATDPDPLATAIEVRSAKDNRVLLSHRFGPRTAGEKRLYALAHAGTLLEPPVVSLISFFSDTRGFPPDPRGSPRSLEPLFANRSRAGLLAVILIVTAGWVAMTMRRLRNRGARAPIVALAGLVVALFGLPAFLLVRMLEPRKAAQVEPAVRPAAEPVLLIQSA